ncbi:MAG: MarR family winged helix-turn-helix transcriptional regulator [Dehalococcoidia bacterium]
MSRRDDIEGIAELFREAIRAQAGALPEPFLKLEITLLQLKAALVLFARGPVSTSVLAQSVGVGPAVVTGVVDRLESHGLAERRPHRSDRRVTLVALSADGEQLVEGITRAGVIRLTELLHALSDEQLEALRYGYAALVDALRTEQLEYIPADPTREVRVPSR